MLSSLLDISKGLELQRQPQFIGIYHHPDFPYGDVVSATPDPPKRQRSFRIAGVGRRRMECVKAYRIKGDHLMARKKAVEVDELEDLENLEDLETDDEAPAKKSRKRGKDVTPSKGKAGKSAKAGKSKGEGKRGPKPLPEGRLGPGDIAKMAGVEPRTVRIYLRNNEIDKTDGRYSFTQKQAETLAKKIKSSGRKAKGGDDD